MMELCESHRGNQLSVTYLDETRVLLKYRLPMAEILTEFFDELKSKTSGYATLDYEEDGYERSNLVKVNNFYNPLNLI